MQEIANLIKLDFICIRKKTLLPMLLGELFFTVCGFLMGPHFLLPIIFFSGLVFFSMFNITAKYNFNRLYGMLPVKRRNIVAARFIATALSILAVTAVSLLLSELSLKAAIFRKYQDPIFDFAFFYDSTIKDTAIGLYAAAIFFLTCAATALMYMFSYAFQNDSNYSSVKKAVIIIASAAIVLIVTAFVSDSEIEENIFGFLIYKVMGPLYVKSAVLFYSLIYGAGAALLLVAAVITNLIIRKREL